MYTNYIHRIVLHEPDLKNDIIQNLKDLNNQNYLKEKLKKFYKPSYYSNLMNLLKDYLKENKNNNNIELLKELFDSLKPAPKLINIKFKSDFINLPSINSEMFIPVIQQNEKINKIIYKISNNKIKESLLKFIKYSEDYIMELVNECLEILKSGKEIHYHDYLFGPPLTILIEGENDEKEISIIDAYKIMGYNKTDKNIDEICFKVGKNSNILEPIKEYMVYMFYFFLYEFEYFISKTQLIFLKDLTFFENELNQINSNYNNKIPIKESLKLSPDLSNETMVTIKASLSIKGKILENFLNDTIENPSLFDKLDRESFSAHVVASFILFTDYKLDTLFIEEDTFRIVRMDIDSDSNDLHKSIINYKNILYTLPLMNEPIHSNIRKSIISKDPYCLIYTWLFQSVCGSIALKNVVKKESENNSTLKQFENSLTIPVKFPDQFINLIIDRMVLVKNEVEKNENITLWELFEKVNFNVSGFYKSLENLIPDNILNDQEQRSDIYPHIKSKYIYQYNLINNVLFDNLELTKEYKIMEKVLQQFKNTELHGNTTEIGNANNSLNLLECLFKCLQIIDIDSLKNDYIVKSYINLIWISIKYFDKIDIKISNECFHPSWENKKYEIVKSLIRTCSTDTLEFFIQYFNVNLNDPKSLEESTFHVALNSKLPLHIVRKQIVILEENKGNIQIKNNGITLLDLSIKNRMFEINNEKLKINNQINNEIINGDSINENDNCIIKLLILYGCISENHNQFLNYYFSLDFKDQFYLKGVIENNLYCNNQRLAWEVALTSIIPIYDPVNGQPKHGDQIIKTSILGNRLLNSYYYNQIFEIDSNEPIKKNKFGTRKVSLMYDGKGNKIYVKFYPQIPGVEIAVYYLNLKLFDSCCTPCCEFALINDIPVLLSQNVPGEILGDLFLNLPTSYSPNGHYDSIILKEFNDKIVSNKPKQLHSFESYYISQILISAMVINEADGNLGNFIVLESGDTQYRIVCIDNDQAFMPPVAKQIKDGKLTKPSLQVETILFLLDNMFELVDQNIIKHIKNKDMDDLVVDWLTHLEIYHDSSSDLVQSICNKKINLNDTVIGIPFAKGQISKLYSKLIRLKSLFSRLSGDNGTITHFDVLQYLEPYIASRYKPILFNESLTILEKYKTLKNINNQTATLSMLTSSTNGTRILLESRDIIPNMADIQESILNGQYGPKQAIEEYYNIRNQKFNFENNIKDIKIIENENINEGLLEKLFDKMDFSTFTIQEETLFFKLLKTKEPELNILNIINSGVFNSSILKSTFKFTYLTKIHIVNGKLFEGLSNTFNPMVLPVLTHLLIKDCPKFTSIKIIANQLLFLNISNCSKLNQFLIESFYLKNIILKDSLSNQNFNNIIEYINLNFKKTLDFLDIGFTKETKFEFNQNKEFSLILPKLKSLKAFNLIGIENLALYLPKCETLEFDLTKSKLMVGQLYSLKNITSEPPSNDILPKLQKIQISLVGFEHVVVGKPFFEHIFEPMKDPTSAFNVIKDYEILKKSPSIDVKSKFSIQSSYCSQFIIFFLDLFSDITINNCFNNLISKMPKFNLKSSRENGEHVTFILIVSKTLLSEHDEKVIEKINDINQKYRIDHQLDLYFEIAKKETFQIFYDKLIDILKSGLEKSNI